MCIYNGNNGNTFILKGYYCPIYSCVSNSINSIYTQLFFFFQFMAVLHIMIIHRGFTPCGELTVTTHELGHVM